MLRSDPSYAAALAAAPDEETRRKVAAAAESLALKLGEVLDPFMETARGNPDFARAVSSVIAKGGGQK